jgi:hypothetical protein
MSLDYDLDKFKICLSHWGVTRVYSVQIKPDQTSSNQINCVVFLDLKHNRLGTQAKHIQIKIILLNTK